MYKCAEGITPKQFCPKANKKLCMETAFTYLTVFGNCTMSTNIFQSAEYLQCDITNCSLVQKCFKSSTEIQIKLQLYFP